MVGLILTTVMCFFALILVYFHYDVEPALSETAAILTHILIK